MTPDQKRAVVEAAQKAAANHRSRALAGNIGSGMQAAIVAALRELSKYQGGDFEGQQSRIVFNQAADELEEA